MFAFRIAPRRLPVSRRGHDELVQPLQLPAVLDEVVRQPVQQFGMRRTLAHRAEVRRRADQAMTEMMKPDAVHQHTRHQRIRPCRQPSRIGQPSSAGRKRRVFLWQDGLLSGRHEHAQAAGRDRLLRLPRIAAMKEMRHRNLVRRLREHADEIFRRLASANLGDLRVDRL